MDIRIWPLLALLTLPGCAPREPITVDTRLEPHELVRIPKRAPAYCAVAEDTVIKRVAIPDTPRWFFKPFAVQPWVAYASEAGNSLLDLTRGYIVPIPGHRDAVPTPDERFLTTPGVYLTRVADLFGEKRGTKPLRLLADLNGEYQSPGVLRDVGNGRIYRLMIGRYKPTIQDFKVWTDARDQLRIEPVNEARRPCPDRRLQLPMLAKDGREFGAYDVASGSTRLFRLNDDNSCSVADDLAIPTGKVSFSFDNRYVAFHLAVRDQASTALEENPDDHWTSNVFIYDRAVRRIGRITHHTAGNAYYPAYRRDGKIVYLFKPLGESYGRYSFVVADPSRIRKWLPISWYTQSCRPGDIGCHQTLALGALWGYTCAKFGADPTPRLAALNTLSLDAASCRAMVTDRWLQWRRSVAQRALHTLPDSQTLLSHGVADLLAKCPD